MLAATVATLLVTLQIVATAMAVPNPGAGSGLQGVFCASASDCFAVGQYTTARGAGANEALRWNGAKWSLTATPNPNRDSTTLNGVTCTSASDCAAVGYYFNNKAATLNEALHWNGKKWSLAATPDPGGSASLRNDNHLNGVACVSASDCYAVGYYTNSSGGQLNEILRWNGTKWTLSATPDPGGRASHSVDNELNGISCNSPKDCVAVGVYVNGKGASVNEALVWNGTKWSLIPMPDPSGSDDSWLNGVACTSTEDCVAVGYSDGRNEALRWNGAKWSLTRTLDPGGSGNFLLGVSCASSDCFAVGWYYHRKGEANEALLWNAKRWSPTPTPDPSGTGMGSNSLYGVDCSSSSDCFAVGTYFNHGAGNFVNEVLHWNGSKWSKG